MINKTKINSILLALILSLSLLLSGCSASEAISYAEAYMDAREIPAAEEAEADQPYEILNGNVPEFSEEELSAEVFESYSPLDSLGRCGQAFAMLGRELMPAEERESIGQIKPSGWHTVRYDDLIADKYLYNRCHLIGFQLAGENANERNLITGTRFMNVEGMLPFENEVAEYIEETGNHVLYRVSPIYEGDELVARGVKMEAESVEDAGAGICFNVFVYNIQPGVTIDYASGESWRSGAAAPAEEAPDGDAPDENESGAAGEAQGGASGAGQGDGQSEVSAGQSEVRDYVININSGKFHLPDCPSVGDMKEKNKEEFRGSREYLIEEGFEPCGSCRP